MKLGDFTALAKNYIYRTGYSERVLGALISYLGAHRPNFVVADVGAGTGKLTDNLIDLGLRGYAVEPNEAMRTEGIQLCKAPDRFIWSAGSAEHTGLTDSSVDWVLMGSSFHWPNTEAALKEFHRILKPGGFFTALWNPRNIQSHPLHRKIEARIYEIVPHIERVSSGSSTFTSRLEELLPSTGHFHNLLYLEAPHDVLMTKERYMGAWQSVNDIQSQAGPEKWLEILQAIEAEIADLDAIPVPYKTRAWTVQARA